MRKKPSFKRLAMFSVHGDPLAKLGSSQSGGQNVYVYELSRHLARKNWHIDIFSRAVDARAAHATKIGQRITVVRLPAGPVAQIAKTDFFNYVEEFLTNFLNYKQKNKLRYDLLHAHYWDGGLVASHAKEILKVPLIQTFHSLGYVRHNTLKKYQRIPTDEQENIFEKRFEIEKQISDKADKIIAESPYEEDDLVSFYQVPTQKISMVPAGVDLKKFHSRDSQKAKIALGLRPSDRVLLYVGRLEWRKGVGTLLVALNKLIAKDPVHAYRLLIVGGNFKKNNDPADAAEYNRLIKIAQENNIVDFVRFLGSIPQKKLSPIYSAADVCVVPSYYEPFGIVPLEAMAMQVPVVASATGGLQYSVLNSETGLLTTPRDPFDLVEKLYILLSDLEFKNKVVANAYTRVSRDFNWSSIAKRIEGVYQQVLKNHSS